MNLNMLGPNGMRLRKCPNCSYAVEGIYELTGHMLKLHGKEGGGKLDNSKAKILKGSASKESKSNYKSTATAADASGGSSNKNSKGEVVDGLKIAALQLKIVDVRELVKQIDKKFGTGEAQKSTKNSKQDKKQSKECKSFKSHLKKGNTKKYKGKKKKHHNKQMGKKKVHGPPTQKDLKATINEILNAGLNVLLIGPAGCGKSHMVREIAKERNQTYHRVTGSIDTSSRDVIGSRSIANGKDFFRPGKAARAAVEGGILFLDDFDFIEPAILAKLYGLLEVNERKLDCPDHDEGEITAAPAFRCVAAGNTGGRVISRKYQGTTLQNAALLSRFVIVPMDYDNDLEKKLLESHGLNGTSTKWLERANTIRRAIKDNNLTLDFTTRDLLAMASLVKQGTEEETAWNAVFYSRLSPHEKQVLAKFKANDKKNTDRPSNKDLLTGEELEDEELNDKEY